MTLLFLESAFSVCVGCKLFNLFKKEAPTNCPGQVCEIRIKEPIQKFSTIQKAILLISSLAIVYGTYAYMTKLPDRTFLVKKIKTMMMSDEELKKKEDLEYQKELEAFDKDDS